MEWKDIDLSPCGSDEFRLAWENIYGDSLEDERHGDVMEPASSPARRQASLFPGRSSKPSVALRKIQ
jgi:hypothetical protein